MIGAGLILYGSNAYARLRPEAIPVIDKRIGLHRHAISGIRVVVKARALHSS